MNYIEQLQKENAALKEKLLTIQIDFNTFMSYLNSGKFQGVERNWISSAEVYNWALEMRQKTLVD